ncbi:type VI secretion system protein ImpK [Methylobacterium sp. OAE515]|uniref:type VI secretion system protein TssL, long form n=1 Tax=Methylobacterium sp. OAE515 TaxID=2817895 RepID=UPI00178B385C
MTENPFVEPGDDDRTFVVPRSGRRAAAPPRAPDPWLGSFTDLPVGNGSPVIAAATPLLSLLARLRNVASVPDASSLRERTVIEVRRYEQALRAAKVPVDLLRTSHYALCASLDDVVQNTPWGSRGSWADASLVSTFHQEVRAGERFFDLLKRICQTPGRFLPAIELMYLCMSLGMQGRYRVSPRGAAELDRVREETYLVILRQRGIAEPALSPHWHGISAPYRPLRPELPVWLAGLAALGLLGLAYAFVLFGLSRSSDLLFDAALAVPPGAMPTIARDGPPKRMPPTPQQVEGDGFARFLEPEIKAGVVSLTGTAAAPIIRVRSVGMFASASATLQPRFRPILERIAAALKSRPGSILIVGYTDDAPIRTIAFPSNYELSRARARAAEAVLSRTLGSGRVRSEGRADADPIADNGTPEGRQQNRRIEIVTEPESRPR